MNKTEEYQQLIQDVRSSYLGALPDYNNKGAYMTWYEDCHEINLWTYWQGRGCLDPTFLVVGQDWGCPSGEEALINNIKEIEKDDSVPYIVGKPSPTDSTLAYLFERVLCRDILNNRFDDLFFTNLCLGYRTKGTSGNLKKSWLKKDYEFFSRLVAILTPKIVICLGRATFEGVLEALAIKKPKIRGYNKFIVSEENPVRGREMLIYGFAHCGLMGTLNRNERKSTSLDLQVKDWGKILE